MPLGILQFTDVDVDVADIDVNNGFNLTVVICLFQAINLHPSDVNGKVSAAVCRSEIPGALKLLQNFSFRSPFTLSTFLHPSLFPSG